MHKHRELLTLDPDYAPFPFFLTLSMHVTSHFVNIHFVNSHLVDVDNVGIDEVGIDKVGRCQMIMLPTCIASNMSKASILVYVSEYKTCKIDQLEAWHPLFLWMLEHDCDCNVLATSACF